MQKVSPVRFCAKPFVRRAPIHHSLAKSPRVGGDLSMNSDAMNYGSHLRDHERNLVQIEKDRERLEDEIVQRQMELLHLANQKTICLQMQAMTKNLMKLPLTEEEKKHLPEGAARLIPADAFKGMKLAEAAEAFLVWFGEPATHRQVIDGLRDGGLDVRLCKDAVSSNGSETLTARIVGRCCSRFIDRPAKRHPRIPKSQT